MAKRRATKTTAKKATSKRTPAKKTAAKKASTTSRKKRAPRKATKKAEAKKATRSTKKRSSTRPKKRELTTYEKRNAGARAKGYESYWDERTSRVRARNALADIGHPNPKATDPETLRDVDELATLGRGDSARELYYKTKRILERYQPAPTDQQIWSLIRIFYKPRGRR